MINKQGAIISDAEGIEDIQCHPGMLLVEAAADHHRVHDREDLRSLVVLAGDRPGPREQPPDVRVVRDHRRAVDREDRVHEGRRDPRRRRLPRCPRGRTAHVLVSEPRPRRPPGAPGARAGR